MRSGSGIATSSGERETAFPSVPSRMWLGPDGNLSSTHERNSSADEINRAI
jgi:hypothetical protein